MSQTELPPSVPTAPPPLETSSPPTVNAWLVIVLLIAVAAVLVRNTGVWRWMAQTSSTLPRTIQPRGDLAGDEKSTIDLFKVASPSVVHITSLSERAVNRFTTNSLQIPEGTGSGFVWDEAGHIVTNYHVIASGNAAMVTLSDNTSLTAKLVGVEPDKDLAVLKVEAPIGTLRPIPVGTSADLQVGQRVFAIGNPFGLDQTLTTGIISGLGREIPSEQGLRTIDGVIQIDAAVNPGNSGGPLLDSAGRLIGVNTAIVSPSGGYAGIGFAVPVDTINEIVPLLIRDGRIERAGLGISLLSNEQAAVLGVTSGAVVWKVGEASAAAAAGILPMHKPAGVWRFEVILSIDGREIRRREDVAKALDGRKVGEKVAVTVLRDGKQETVSITLQSLSQPTR
ncbi:MAG: trypsin-like peptidase domain-containing protein [Planctomycetaceae bacterium]|nr:trypsin-like peptidase domain-containing protein [Planctomycetaceae bacterium]